MGSRNFEIILECPCHHGMWRVLLIPNISNVTAGRPWGGGDCGGIINMHFDKRADDVWVGVVLCSSMGPILPQGMYVKFLIRR